MRKTNGEFLGAFFTVLTYAVLAASPPIYLHLIFAKFQFEISSLMNLIFGLFQTGIFHGTQAVNIKFKLDKKSSLSNSIFQTGVLQKSSADRQGERVATVCPPTFKVVPAVLALGDFTSCTYVILRLLVPEIICQHYLVMVEDCLKFQVATDEKYMVVQAIPG